MPDYALSDIYGSEGKSVKAGDPVSASALGLTDEEYQELVDAGAVSDEKPEDMGSFSGSPAQWETLSDEEKEVYTASEEELNAKAAKENAKAAASSKAAAADEGK